MNRRKSLVKEDSVGNINFDHDAAERASFDHGITNRSIFTGAMLLKKMGHESTYKKRYIWIDAQDRSFHWNKQPDRSSVHKSVSLAEGGDVQAVEFRSRPAKYRGQGPEPALCLSLVLNSGDVIDLQTDSVQETKEWEKVLNNIMMKSKAAENEKVKTEGEGLAIAVPPVILSQLS